MEVFLRRPASVSHVDLSFALGSTLPTFRPPLGNTFAFSMCFWCGVFHGFAPSFWKIQSLRYRWHVHPLVFMQNTFYTCNLSIYIYIHIYNTIWPFPKPWFTHRLRFELKLLGIDQIVHRCIQHGLVRTLKCFFLHPKMNRFSLYNAIVSPSIGLVSTSQLSQVHCTY